MTATNFAKSLAFLLKDEGGNDDDPADHGGRTSRGVTQKEYDAWRREQKLRTRDVWTATNDEIRTIYHDKYWMPHGDVFPTGLDYLYFDMAVNAGPRRAAILLQRALGLVQDGKIGPITRAGVRTTDALRLIDKYTDVKRSYYRSLNQPRFIRGWLNRCDHVARNARSMVFELPEPPAVAVIKTVKTDAFEEAAIQAERDDNARA